MDAAVAIYPRGQRVPRVRMRHVGQLDNGVNRARALHEGRGPASCPPPITRD